MIGSLYKNKNRKNQENCQIYCYSTESRECEKEEGVKDEAPERWQYQSPLTGNPGRATRWGHSGSEMKIFLF